MAFNFHHMLWANHGCHKHDSPAVREAVAAGKALLDSAPQGGTLHPLFFTFRADAPAIHWYRFLLQASDATAKVEATTFLDLLEDLDQDERISVLALCLGLYSPEESLPIEA